ncbi:MAG: phosphoribosylamine--glycine ligase [Bacteroidales bacterium]|nr:phosphoribosylamine--glycine ligase [Bacteroidales bacterium]
MSLKVLVVGSGGREHAIAWKISQSDNLAALFCLPGNPGTASIATNIPGSVGDFEAIAAAVEANCIDMVVVGPENPLVGGLTDFLRSRFPGLMIIGPSKTGAQLEGSKEFAKDFMARHGIPTAAYRAFTAATLPAACEFLKTLQPPYVLKADGLAAGKGVVILDNYDAACSELEAMFSGKFGEASSKVVIEQFLKGIEVSVFVLTDGSDYLILPEAKDYKRIGEGDTGLNTGGMGAVSPVPFADAAFMGKVEERIIKPTVAGLAADGIDYKGFIFIGLMNCGGDPYVIEYNVRMGDPETESVMTRIDSDLLAHLEAAAKGTLAGEAIKVSGKSAVTVVIVSGGYPEKYKSLYPIHGLEVARSRSVNIFHMGTKDSSEGVVSSGGRVLAVTANGSDMARAAEKAYKAVADIDFKDCYHRGDITKDLEKYL